MKKLSNYFFASFDTQSVNVYGAENVNYNGSRGEMNYLSFTSKPQNATVAKYWTTKGIEQRELWNGTRSYEEGNGDEIVGITIPHRVFKKIGQYNVKLFPFSFDDYESQIREDEEPITVTPKEVTPKFIETPIKELPPPPKPEDIVNPYKPPVPNRGGGGGGSGGGQEQFISEEQFGIDRGFGSGNGGEQPGRPNRNLNYF